MMQQRLTDANGKAEDGGASENILDQVGLASADQRGRLAVVLVVVGRAGDTVGTMSDMARARQPGRQAGRTYAMVRECDGGGLVGGVTSG